MSTVPVKTRLLSQTIESHDSDSLSDTPDLYQFIDYNPERYPYLLYSSARRKDNTQYDILLACPQYHLILDSDHQLHCTAPDIDNSSWFREASFLDALDRLILSDTTDTCTDAELPFTGGWFVYLSYEMAAEIEPCLSLPEPTENQPLAVASRCPAAIIFDRNSQQLIVIAEQDQPHLLDQIENDYIILTNQNKNKSSNVDRSNMIYAESITEADVDTYLSQVERIKRYIVDGDIFQANLSRPWQIKIQPDITDTELFNALAISNPSSFAAIACLSTMTIISSSPERLVCVRDGMVETRPIAGTRPRDNNHNNDSALSNELLTHPKEQAEHIMLIDLERNDLGRVCNPGSVEVNELMVLESWQHVHHIVSNVRGKLQQDKTPVDVLRAVFPGGTITGCPKIRCMEILAELEQQARGAYTGSLGYINTDGSMDFNILIRTLVVNRGETADGTTTTVHFRAGGGIVNDSIPQHELEETRAKAKGLLTIFS